MDLKCLEEGQASASADPLRGELVVCDGGEEAAIKRIHGC